MLKHMWKCKCSKMCGPYNNHIHVKKTLQQRGVSHIIILDWTTYISQGLESWAIDLCHWKLVLCNWIIHKSSIVVDLHCSFIDLGQLHRTRMLVVHIYLSIHHLVEDTSPMRRRTHGNCHVLLEINTAMWRKPHEDCEVATFMWEEGISGILNNVHVRTTIEWKEK